MQPLDKRLGGFSGFKVLLNVLLNLLSQHSGPDLVKDQMFYGVVPHGTDSPLTTEDGCAEELLDRFFHYVHDRRQRVYNLEPDDIIDYFL